MKKTLIAAALGISLLGSAHAQSTQSTPPAPTSGHNVHKDRDHRFKTCKAAATAAAVPTAELNAYLAACMKKAT